MRTSSLLAHAAPLVLAAAAAAVEPPAALVEKMAPLPLEEVLPLLDFDRLLVVKRARGTRAFPDNHRCHAALPRDGYDNEITILSPVHPGGALRRSGLAPTLSNNGGVNPALPTHPQPT